MEPGISGTRKTDKIEPIDALVDGRRSLDNLVLAGSVLPVLALVSLRQDSVQTRLCLECVGRPEKQAVLGCLRSFYQYACLSFPFPNDA